jgi:archaellum component FlaC
MNNIRRNKLSALATKLEEIAEEINNIKCEEEEAYDNLPDGIKDSDKGQEMNSNVNRLEEVYMDIMCGVAGTIHDIVS